MAFEDKGSVSKDYLAALEEHNIAFRKFDVTRAKYRRGEIPDSEFLKAKSDYEAATRKFDAEFARESFAVELVEIWKATGNAESS